MLFFSVNDGQAYNLDIKCKTAPSMMPPLTATPSRISKNLTYETGLIEPNANNSRSIVKNHPLKRLQSKSLDEPIEEIEKKSTNDTNKLVSINKNKVKISITFRHFPFVFLLLSIAHKFFSYSVQFNGNKLVDANIVYS
jgi:hypothetical protein